jgi:hypothetical protein
MSLLWLRINAKDESYGAYHSHAPLHEVWKNLEVAVLKPHFSRSGPAMDL